MKQWIFILCLYVSEGYGWDESALDLRNHSLSQRSLPLQPLDYTTVDSIAFPEFVISKAAWEEIPPYVESFFYQQFRSRHAYYLSDDFRVIRTGETLSTDFLIPCRDSDIKYKISHQTYGHYQLFLSFNKAIVDIIETVTTLFRDAQYLRSDLLKIRSYLGEAILFFRQTERLGQSNFQSHFTEVNKEAFFKDLDKTPFIAFEEIKRGQNAFTEELRQNHASTMDMYQFVAFHSDLYAKFLINFYYQLKTHLISSNKLANSHLNRKKTGALQDFTFTFEEKDLEEVSLLQEGGSFPLTKSQKKRQKRKEKKVQKQLLQAEEPLKESYPLIASSELIEEVLPMEEIEVPAVLKEEEEEIIFEEDDTSSILSTPSTASYATEISSPSSSSQSTPEKYLSFPRTEESKIHSLQKVLESHANAHLPGAKARNFISFAKALNKLGYFEDFKATEREVKIKLGGDTPFITSIHMDHGRGRESTLKTESAKKMAQVIERLQGKLLKE